MWDLGKNRLILGTSRYPSPAILEQAILRSKVDVVTVSLRREVQGGGFWDIIKALPVKVLPNTAGCHSAKEAITFAEMAREIFDTDWVKLEVTGDTYTLQPHPIELVKAAEELVKRGFRVFPYTTEDLVIARQLIDVGCNIIMPWVSPIGTGRGIANPYALKTLRTRFPDVTMIVDAGIGTPSQACQAMEMGMDGVILNSAVALAQDPPAMAEAFAQAIHSGLTASQAGLMPTRDLAEPSTPVIGTPFWYEKEKL